MQTEFIVNGGVSLLLSPQNAMEEELLKQLMKQNNDMVEIRTSVFVLNKTFQNGLLIAKKTTDNQPSNKGETLNNEEDQKAL